MLAESPTKSALHLPAMAPVEPQKKWTYAEIAALPDDRLRELHDGRPVLMPSPNLRHQKLYLRLLFALQQWIENGGGGLLYPQPVDLKIDNYRALIPDLSYYATANAASVESENGNYLRVAPDLVVEIVSPSSASTDRVYKLRVYAEIGVAYYWIIDPMTRVFQAFRLEAGEYRFEASLSDEGEFAPAVFPGLSLPMAQLFGPFDPTSEVAQVAREGENN